MLPEKEEVPIVLQLEKDKYGRLFALWKDGISAVNDKDLMWRTAMGGLKTGSFIRRYNVPGAKLGCKLCSGPLETCQHVISILKILVYDSLMRACKVAGVVACPWNICLSIPEPLNGEVFY